MNGVNELRSFIFRMQPDPSGYMRTHRYWYEIDPKSVDFNRQIVHPGTPIPPEVSEQDISPNEFQLIQKTYTDGALGIRVSADYLIVALLPYRFHKCSIQLLVSQIWPTIFSHAYFHGDSDDQAYWKRYLSDPQKPRMGLDYSRIRIN